MNRYIAEAIATFMLVFAGTGAIITNDLSGGAVTHVGVSLTFGLVVTSVIYAIGNISGAHLNPAVTLGFFAAQRLGRSEVFPYIAAQCAGALAASGLLRIIFANHAKLGATLPTGPVFQSFALEVVLTFFLMFVILNVSTGAMEKGIMAGVAVGATVALGALLGGPISGASMNPARSIGPALISGNLQHLWIYLTAPILGALLAFPTCRLVQGKDCCLNTEC